MQLFIVKFLLLSELLTNKGCNSYLVLEIVTNSGEDCHDRCNMDEKCYGWTYDVPRCYLESYEISLLKSEVQIYMNYSHTKEFLSSHKKLKKYYVQTLIKDEPLVFDSSMMLNYDEHFYRGCEYSISLWVWVWKVRHPQPYVEIPIFTTRILDPSYNKHEELYPSIIYHTSHNPERFFFAFARDKDGGHSGLWTNANMKYQEWVHLTLVSTKSHILTYVNGEESGAAGYNSPLFPGRNFTCPYQDHYSSKTGPNGDGDDREEDMIVNNTVFQLGGSRNRKGFVGMMSNVQIFRNIAMNLDQVKALYNSFQPRSSPMLSKLLTSYGIYTTEGFCPRAWKGNDYLLYSWGICPESICGPLCIDEGFLTGKSLTGIRMKGDKDNNDLGVSSISKSVYSQYYQDVYDSYEDETIPVTVGENIDMYVDDILHPDATTSATSSAYSNDLYGSDNVNEGGAYDDSMYYDEDVYALLDGYYGDENALRAQIADGIYEEVEELERRQRVRQARTHRIVQGSNVDPNTKNPSDKVKKSANIISATNNSQTSPRRLVVDIPRRDPIRRRSMRPKAADIVSPVVESNHTSFRSFFHPSFLRFYLESPILFVRSLLTWIGVQLGFIEVIGIEDIDYMDHSVQTNAALDEVSSPSFKSTVSTTDHVQELYDAGMIWLSGRYENSTDDINLSANEWANKAHSRANAAMSLALWLADDITTDADMDIYWNFRYPSVLAHPIHSYFGNYHGFANKSLLSGTPSATGKGLQDALGIAFEDLIMPGGFTSHSSSSNGSVADFNVEYFIKNLLEMVNLKFKEKVSYETDITGELAQSKELLPDVVQRDWLDVLAMIVKSQRVNSGEATVGQGLEQILQKFSSFRDKLKSKTDWHILSKNPSEIAEIARNNQLNNELKCMSAAAHYFPLSQYTTSHFGILDSGVGHLEQVYLTGLASSSWGFAAAHGVAGEDDQLHQVHEAEAEGGNADAQLWLARRYYWGWGGLQPNVRMARQWFERAAAQGNAEGLYNVGVMEAHGQGGFQPNLEAALANFRRAADLGFPMAVHALGNHHLGHLGDPNARNISLAREWFQKAADLDSPEGHFSLAALLKDGEGGERNIEEAVKHFCKAASSGHLRSINFLAHALYDSESWLGSYSREKVHRDKRAAKRPTPQPTLHPSGSSPRNYSHNASDFKITLGTETIQLPYPLRTSCLTALPLLRYLASIIYRTNIITKKALAEYLNGQLWNSLDLYDEAAELGVLFAMDNSAYLYEVLKKRECTIGGNGVKNNGWGHEYETRSSSSNMTTSTELLNWIQSLIKSISGSSKPVVNSKIAYISNHDQSKNNNRAKGENCTRLLSNMEARRWLQMARINDSYGQREVADRLVTGADGLPMNAPLAAYLYAEAADKGDHHSLTNLGWLLFRGAEGVPRNLPAASKVLMTAVLKEVRYNASAEETFQQYIPTMFATSGVAPAIALLIVKLSILYDAMETFLDQIFSITFFRINGDVFVLTILVFLFILIYVFQTVRRRQ